MTEEKLLETIERARVENWTELYLRNQNLTEFPTKICDLTNLQTLVLDDNQITKIPREIGNLTNLQFLYVTNNQIAEIPQEIGNLTNLRALELSHNQITEIPQEIGNLINLQTLELSDNQITKIPQEIINLINLQEFVFDKRILRTSSSEIIFKLKNMTIGIWDDDNYGSSYIPPDIIQTFKTGQDLINYYFGGRDIKLNEVKIMLIGQGNVGKTSVRQRLMNVSDYQSKGRTEGVEIHQQIFSINYEIITANIWDFGGQEIYHTTHQFFFRSRCLYILVLDARAEDRGNSQLHYWLRQTQALGRNAPVIVAINKCEKQDDINGQQKELDKRYAAVKDIVLELKDKKFQNIVGCLPISTDMNLGIDKLNGLIKRTIKKRLPAVSTMITKTEEEVKDFLENQTKDYVSDEEFKEICRDIDEKERKDLITILDALGIITSFDDEHLSKTVVLKPEWITKGIYKILSSHFLSQDNGKVERENINDIFENNDEEKAKYPPDKIDYILAIMEKHDLCISESVGGGKKHLLFPVSFKVKEPSRLPFAENTTHFEYRYKNIFFDSIIVRFLCTAYRQFGGEEKGNYWRKGVEFYWNDKKNRALVKADDVENKIIIKIDGETSTREVLLAEITRIFDKIHDSFGKLETEMKIIAPKNVGKFEFDYETLKNRLQKGHETIPETNAEGEELQFFINYLLKGEGKLIFTEEKIQIADEIAGKKQLFEVLKDLKNNCDRESERAVKLIVGLLFLGILILIVAVWVIMVFLILKDENAWDKYEKWTWIISSGMGLIAFIFIYGYLAVTTKEFSPKDIYGKLIENKKEKKYLAFNFPKDEFEKLCCEIEKARVFEDSEKIRNNSRLFEK